MVEKKIKDFSVDDILCLYFGRNIVYHKKDEFVGKEIISNLSGKWVGMSGLQDELKDTCVFDAYYGG